MAEVQPGTSISANGIAPVVLKQSGPSRDAMLADMAKLDDAKPPMKVSTDETDLAEQRKGAAAAKTLGDATEAAADDPPNPSVDEASRDGEGDAGEVPPATVEAKVADAPDKETERRLKVVREAEKRAKDAISRERTEAQRERAELDTTKREYEAKIAKLDAAAKRAKIDPWGVLRELGLVEDDAEHAAKVIYANSKAAAADPKNRAAIEAEIRRRDGDDRLTALERRNQELEQRETARETASENSRIVNEYLDGVTKEVAAAATAPLTKALLAKNPAKARAELHRIAHELSMADDETPTAAEVIQAYEKRRAAELEELGFTPDMIAKQGAPAAPVTDTGKSRTLGAGGGVTPVKKKATEADLRNEIVRALETDKLEL